MQQPVTCSHPTTTGATAQHAMSHPTTRPPIRGTRHTTARRQPHTTATHHRQPGDQDSTPTQLSRSRPTARQPRTPATPSQTRHSQHGTTRKASRGQYRARRCPPKNARCHRCTSPTPSHCHPSEAPPTVPPPPPELAGKHPNPHEAPPADTATGTSTDPTQTDPTTDRQHEPSTRQQDTCSDQDPVQAAQAAAAADPQPLDAPAQAEQHSTSCSSVLRSP